MPLVLNDEQQMLQDAARGFVEEKSPVSALRKLRDDNDPNCFDTGLWKEMGEMGWAGVLVDEDNGGSDFGFVGAGVIAEEMGRTLTASPFFSTSILAATAIGKYGADEQKKAYLPKIAAADIIMALAVDEGNKHNPEAINLKAEKSGNGFKLTGEKTFVADGAAADSIIVAARSAGAPGEKEGVSLFIVDAKANGLTRERVSMVDNRNSARLSFEGVEVTGEDVLGEVDQGYGALEGILSAGRAGLAAEMSGASQAAFGMTLDYLKERKQFGKTIGAFQALQHRAADLYTEVELMRAISFKALQELDNNFDGAGMICAIAKAKTGQVAKLVSQEGVQMHGGIGMTDEYDLGFYMKRIRVAQELLGDTAFHSDAIAKLRGY